MSGFRWRERIRSGSSAANSPQARSDLPGVDRHVSGRATARTVVAHLRVEIVPRSNVVPVRPHGLLIPASTCACAQLRP